VVGIERESERAGKGHFSYQNIAPRLRRPGRKGVIKKASA